MLDRAFITRLVNSRIRFRVCLAFERLGGTFRQANGFRLLDGGVGHAQAAQGGGESPLLGGPRRGGFFVLSRSVMLAGQFVGNLVGRNRAVELLFDALEAEP